MSTPPGPRLHPEVQWGFGSQEFERFHYFTACQMVVDAPWVLLVLHYYYSLILLTCQTSLFRRVLRTADYFKIILRFRSNNGTNIKFWKDW